MDFVNGWSEKAELPLCRFIAWLGIAKSKFYDWHSRYGKVNEHNGKIPREFLGTCRWRRTNRGGPIPVPSEFTVSLRAGVIQKSAKGCLCRPLAL